MEEAKQAVFQECSVQDLGTAVKGIVSPYFVETVDSYSQIGFQATNLGRAIDILKEVFELNGQQSGPHVTVFLSIPFSPILTCVRNYAARLVALKQVHVLVFTGGVVEADVAQIFGPATDLQLDAFQSWFNESLAETLVDPLYTPSQFSSIIGKELIRQVEDGRIPRADAERSITYWAAKHEIPIYVPSWADGTLAFMLYKRNFVVDLVRDVVAINKFTMKCEKTAMIIIGGGVAKHHTCNANLMRNGADYAIYLSTSQEYDGSDGGANPEEAVSWGKIRIEAKRVKVYGDAAITFPILVSRCELDL